MYLIVVKPSKEMENILVEGQGIISTKDREIAMWKDMK